MKKKVFALLFLLAALAFAASAVSLRVKGGRGWPETQEDYESMMETALDSWGGTREVAGAAGLVLQPVAAFTDGEVIVRTEGNFLLPLHTELDFDMDRAVERIGALRDYCDSLGIPLLYVSYPSKASYTDSDPVSDFGIRAVDGETREQFLQRLRDLGVTVLDFAGVLREKGYSQEDVFYRTDHHWRTRVGLAAAGEIAEYLKTECGLKVETGLLEEEYFHTADSRHQWLGETGRKVSAMWAGTLDGYTLYEPNYETSFMYYVPSSKLSEEGDFSAFLDRTLFDRKPDLYRDSLFYVYMKDSKQVTQFRNKNLTGTKILMIRDSYAIPVAPFLAAAVRDLYCWDMRENTDTVFAYIDKHRFNAVIIAYTDFWRDEMYDFR